jgi:hypothetical protein
MNWKRFRRKLSFLIEGNIPPIPGGAEESRENSQST